MRIPLCAVLSLVLVGACGSSGGSEVPACQAAADHLAACFGGAPTTAALDCDVETATWIAAQECDQLAMSEAAGKADGWWDSFMCELGFMCYCSGGGAPLQVQIIDDDDDAWGGGGPWSVVAAGGHDGGGYHRALANHGARASWHPFIAAPGRYAVRAFVPAGSDLGNVTYTVVACDRETSVAVSQAGATGRWVDLGTFNFGPEAYVSLWALDGAMAADAVELTLVAGN